MSNSFRRANLFYRFYHRVFRCAEEGQKLGFDPLPRKIRCRSALKKAQILKTPTTRRRYVQIPGNSVSVALRQKVPKTQAGLNYPFFQCPSFYYRSCHGHLPPPPPFWTFRLFFLPLVEGYFLHFQGLLLRPVISNGVHSVDESVFSPRTRFVDFFTSIARVFLDSLRLASCSYCLKNLYHQIENTKFLHALIVFRQGQTCQPKTKKYCVSIV